MIARIKENLSRQITAMKLLLMMQEEEFAMLGRSDPQTASGLDVSIQELIRQLTAERYMLRRLVGAVKPGADRMHHILPDLEVHSRLELVTLLGELDKGEQKCAVQAAKNHRLSQGLLEQNTKLLHYLHEAVQPKDSGCYSARGRFMAPRAQSASLITGRL